MQDLVHASSVSQNKRFLNSSLSYALFSALIAIVLFLLIYGVAPLIPTNVSFLYNRWFYNDQDPMSHQLGFDFYRHSSWLHPIGLTDNYPYPYPSSVINSDSIPILAIPLKLLSPILPDYFQYFGIWILFCFIMQGITAALLLKELKVRPEISLASVPLFICNVPLLFRCFHHSALAAQWLILLCFLLFIKQKSYTPIKKTLSWGVLCGISVLIHGYLFIITGALMTFSCIYEIIFRKKCKESIITFFFCVICFFLCFYEGGGFAASSNIEVFGLGLYTLDLADFFNPAFSLILSPFPYEITTEDANYLGLGILILFGFALLLLIIYHSKMKTFIQTHRSSFLFLLFVVVSFTLLALGVRGRFAGSELYDLRPYLSPKMRLTLSGLRSSARFIWPVWYLLLLSIIVSISRLATRHNIAVILLLFCCVIQYIDVVPVTAIDIPQQIEYGYDSSFEQAFNSCFNGDAKHLCLLGPRYSIDAMVFAAHHAMSVNGSKVGRGPKNHQQIDTDEFNAGIYKQDTVYVIHIYDLYYLSPDILPSEYKVYICDNLVCIFNQKLLNTPPSGNAAELSAENLSEIIMQLKEINDAPEPIDDFEDI